MPGSSGIPLTIRVLRSTRNPAAIGVLAAAVHAAEPKLRTAAVRALADRSEPDAQAELLAALVDAPADARQESCERPIAKRMAKATIRAIKSGEPTPTKQACRYAIDAELFTALPGMIEQAAVADHPYGVGLATATLRLCRVMAGRLHEGRSARDRNTEDPSFYRPAALQSLTNAVERFGEHERLELIESLLLITTRDNTRLVQLLRAESHASNQVLTNVLATSPSVGALDLLSNALVDSDTPQRVLDIAAGRADRAFLVRMTDHVGYPLGVRTRDNARRVKSFAWMNEPHRTAALTLTGQQLSTLVSLAAQCTAPQSERLAFVRFVFQNAPDEARVAASRLLRDFNSHEVMPLLNQALQDERPEVVASAARQLRSHGMDGSKFVLISLLEHPDEQVRRVAQDELHELNLRAFREVFEKLPKSAQRVAGELVARADPDAPAELAAALERPIVRERFEGLELIEAMGLVDELLGPLCASLEDRDTGIRAEAARLLGEAKRPVRPMLEALVEATDDSNSAVSTAAAQSLDSLRALDEAAALIRELQAEFDAKQREADQ